MGKKTKYYAIGSPEGLAEARCRIAEAKRIGAEELDIGRYVNFLGFVEHERMPAYYAQADLLVLPSRREGFPLVLPEAMASGLPVVATTVGGVPEIVTDSETGLLVPPENPRALSEAINSLLNDPDRMKAMGIRGRKG